MSNKQIRAMMRSPQKLIKFQMTGRLPSENKAPSTPLLELINKIPAGLWGRFIGVTIDHRVGFTGSRQFNSLHQVAQWIGHNKTIIDNQTMPYQSWTMRGFRQKVLLADLIDVCSKAPDLENSSVKHALSRAQNH